MHGHVTKKWFCGLGSHGILLEMQPISGTRVIWQIEVQRADSWVDSDFAITECHHCKSGAAHVIWQDSLWYIWELSALIVLTHYQGHSQTWQNNSNYSHLILFVNFSHHSAKKKKQKKTQVATSSASAWLWPRHRSDCATHCALCWFFWLTGNAWTILTHSFDMLFLHIVLTHSFD